MEREKLTPSESVHRRRVLAEERKKGLPPGFLEQQVSDSIQAERRLGEIEFLLDAGKPEKSLAQDLTPVIEASLRAEKVWLQFRLGRITQAERQSHLQRMLNSLEDEQPDVFRWLTEEDDEGLSPFVRIRDKVIPPSKAGGYYTKRGRG